MHLHLKPPRNAFVIGAFWLVAFLPWLVLTALLLLNTYSGIRLLGPSILIVIAIWVREWFLETPAEKEARIRKIRAPISQWWIPGLLVLAIGAILLLVYLARRFSGNDLSWLFIVAAIAACFLVPWDVVAQYRRAKNES